MAIDQQTAKPALRCGVLIIGSLIWDQGGNGVRKDWRSSRLDLGKQVRVHSHLRYGRKSETRGNTFTMVLDARCPGGQAVIVPCKTEIREIEGLAEEVRWLWAAEDNSAVLDRFHKSWGCVGALFGPKAVECGLQDQWRDHFQAAKPSSPVALDSDGQLNIPWPSTVEGVPVPEFDVLLATTTMPNPNDRRPEADEIAQAWIQQNDRRERYFFENVRHGIRTRDDPDIWRIIAEQKPRWLKSGEYAEAIKELRSEANARKLRAQPQRSQ